MKQPPAANPTQSSLEDLMRLKHGDYRGLLGLILALIGLLMGASPNGYEIPVLDTFADKFWLQGFIGLSLIITGILLVIVKR